MSPGTRVAAPCLALAVAFAGVACFQNTGVVAPDARVEKLAGGFAFTEGPTCDPEGNVYFTDIPNNRIHKWSVNQALTTFREDSGGANGLHFDHQGHLLACEGENRRITSTSPGGDMTVLVERYEGKRLNSPNDLWVDPEAGVYFTDPRYDEEDNLEQDGLHVYYLPSGANEPIRVIDDLVRPNGIVGTPDGSRLYVADEGDDKTWVYRIEEDGSLTEKRLFALQDCDGMTIDERGNVYLTHGSVHVYNPEGEKVTSIETPEAPTNVCFGGKDRKTLFITARQGLYAIKMNVSGPGNS